MFVYALLGDRPDQHLNSRYARGIWLADVLHTDYSQAAHVYTPYTLVIGKEAETIEPKRHVRRIPCFEKPRCISVEADSNKTKIAQVRHH